MKKDACYATVQQRITQGKIKRLSQIIEVIPKAVVASDLQITLHKLDSKLVHIEKFSFRHISFWPGSWN